MNGNERFQCCGENGFTFEFFEQLSRNPDKQNIFYKYLRYQDKKEKSVDYYGKLEKIYLFPNFGKRWGLGEPDVVIITRKTVLVIEVETYIKPRSWYNLLVELINTTNDLRNIKRYKKTPLYQLERFYMIEHSLKKDIRGDSRRLCSVLPFSDQLGTDNKTIKNVRLRSKTDLSDIIKQMENKKVHTVLFSIRKNPEKIEFFFQSLELMGQLWATHENITYNEPSSIPARIRTQIRDDLESTPWNIDQFARFIYGPIKNKFKIEQPESIIEDI